MVDMERSVSLIVQYTFIHHKIDNFLHTRFLPSKIKIYHIASSAVTNYYRKDCLKYSWST